MKRRKATPEYNLKISNPSLAKEWHPTKNGKLTPYDFTPRSGEKVWWQCSRGHEWEATVDKRSIGRGCPYCSNKKVSKDNCLATVNPKLANEWHPTKNGKLTPEDIVPGSNKKVWWQCKKGHEWKTSLNNRLNGTGCPYCSGKYASKENCLATVNPKLASEWHPTKNGNLLPKDVTPSTPKKVWWQCKKGHEWQASPNNRSKGNGCPYCSGKYASKENCLATLNPKLASEWHPTKNGKLFPSNVMPGSAKKAWWQCSKGHEWEASPNSRSRGTGCPYCSGVKVCEDNCLAKINSKLSKEWHPTKNSKLTPEDVLPGSERKVWWRCSKGHEWRARINSRNKGVGCPYCSGNSVCEDNCLATMHPKLVKEWHPIKNKELTPNDITPGSNRKVWWRCSKGHEWQAPSSSRTQGVGCPYCGNKKVCKDNCLAIVNPKLANEWHPIKNGKLTPEDVVPGSTRKIWWRCKKGHEWQAILANRSKGIGCPHCNSQTSMMELRIYTELKTIFPDIRLREKINKIECDIYIPSLKLGIEYDGIYWHRNKYKKDLTKNIALEKKGIKLIRIRDMGLEKVSEEDVIYNYKQKREKFLVDKVLKKIGVLFPLSILDRARLNGYLKKSRLVNDEEFISLLNMLPSPLPGKSLADLNSQLSKEWHPTKNGKLTPEDVLPGSNKKVWWQCSKGHEWQAMVANRSKGVGCPYCSNKKICEDNCLSTVNPKLASEWHPTKNGALDPGALAPISGKRVWWKCNKGHEWQATVANRAKGKGCPYCSNKKVCKDNCLATVNPKLAKEWHLTKNGKLTAEDVVPGSNKKVWWQCSKGHEWKTAVAERSNGTGCPYCSVRRVRKDNSLQTFFPFFRYLQQE